MKKIYVSALAVIALMSCSKENPNERGTPDGVVTYARVEVVQPASNAAPAARGYTRGTASAEEKKVNNLSVYVFDKHKALEQIVDMNASEVVSGKEFRTVTGEHFFIVAANKPAGMPVIAVGEYLETVEKKLYSVANRAGLDLISLGGNATGGNFFMTNINGAQSEVLPGGGEAGSPVATITLKVGRAMAKVSATVSASVSQPKGSLKNEAAGDIQYMVAGNPVSMHTFPVVVDGQLRGPFFADSYNAANYFPAIAPGHTYTDISAMLSNMGQSAYAVENSNKTPAFGESTYLIITGTYKPDEWYKADGTPNAVAAAYGDTFYRIGKKNAAGKVESYTDRVYSENLSAAQMKAELDLLGIAESDQVNYMVVEYLQGRVYYGLWLADNTVSGNPTKKYTVARNNFFKVVVNEINGPGSNKPDLIPVPTDPIEKETWIQAEILVEDWSVVDQGAIIG